MIAPKLRSRRRWLAVGLLVLLLVPILAYVAICAYAADALTTAPRNLDRTRTPDRLGATYEPVRFPSRTAGLELAGWYLPSPDADRALVMVHGHTSSRTTEFDGRFVDLVVALHQRGFAVLAFDLRGHGESSDAHIGFGSLEHDDVGGAIDWLRSRGFAAGRIGTFGVSMGGAATIRAVADNPDVAALAVDSAPARVLDVIRQEWPTASGLPDLFLPTTLFFARIRHNVDLAAAPAIAVIPQVAPRPTLFIHGDADELVDPVTAAQLAAALPGSELWMVAGAEHARAYLIDPQAYNLRVGDFFERAIP